MFLYQNNMINKLFLKRTHLCVFSTIIINQISNESGFFQFRSWTFNSPSWNPHLLSSMGDGNHQFQKSPSDLLREKKNNLHFQT